jgi:uracil-DNA glycosylase
VSLAGPTSAAVAGLEAEVRACRLCAGRFAATVTAHAPRPVPWLSDAAPILIAGQAPGARVHDRGRPFDDASGDRLRDWLGVDRAAFYDRRHFAVLPMAFCFPGYDARGADLPPPPVCAATWRARALAAMPQVRLTLLIGGHAQRWRLGPGGVTATVARWREFGPALTPLPHPSWRNTAWLRRNPWFETELAPELRRRVAALIEGADRRGEARSAPPVRTRTCSQVIVLNA